MKKLEDIPKKEVFSVPEGYFEKLPGAIQARIAKESPGHEGSYFLRYSLKFALPAIVLAAAVIFWYTTRNEKMNNAESILASVQTDELIAYLNESDISTDDVLEHVRFNETDLEEIESEVYDLHLNEVELDEMSDVIDLDTL